jgi:uncharacterized membrane protein YbhN (UPF0104 family)
MANKRALKILLLVAKVAVIAACFVYIFLVIWRNLANLRQTEFTFRLLPLIASFPFAVGYLLGRGLIWHLVVRRMIGRFPLHADLLSWMSSLLGKYLPGKVFLLFGRVYFYRGSGATTGQVSLCFLIEACCSGLATLAIFGAAAAWQRTAALGVLRPLMAAVAVVLLIATHPTVLRAGINAGLRLARRPEVEIRLRWRDVLGWTLLLSANWLVLGAGFYLLLRAIIDVPPTLYMFVTGAFAVAGIVGVLVLFAPSGIGVREGVMTFVLSAVLPAGVAAVAAILARIWMTLTEALCSGIALLLVRGASFREPRPDAAIEQRE